MPPTVIPQFSDSVEMVRAANDIKGFVASALIPNLKGAQRAFAVGIGKVNFVLSGSEAHNLSNVRRSTQESLEDFKRIAQERAERNVSAKLAGGIATAFGCAIQGAVPETRVYQIIETLLEAGADEIILADSVGYANPVQVRRIFTQALRIIGERPVFAHFHDTRGFGLANVAAALDVGVTRFDASLGGLGGRPFAPGATGNINLEDCAFMMEAMGFDTGLDIEALIALRGKVERWLPTEKLHGMVSQAGLPKIFGPRPSRNLTACTNRQACRVT